jgi:hypothetical protein
MHCQKPSQGLRSSVSVSPRSPVQGGGSVGSQFEFSSLTAFSPTGTRPKENSTYLISAKEQRLSRDSENRPGERWLGQSRTREERGARSSGAGHALLGSSILFTAPLIQAASRRTTNSKPSLETRVTYLLGSVAILEGFWSERLE